MTYLANLAGHYINNKTLPYPAKGIYGQPDLFWSVCNIYAWTQKAWAGRKDEFDKNLSGT